jgi:hypothetical protein
MSLVRTSSRNFLLSFVDSDRAARLVGLAPLPR